MSLSIVLWFVAVAVPLIFIGAVLLRRPRKKPARARIRSAAPVSGSALLELSVANNPTPCDAARQILGRHFPASETPPTLPLTDCSTPAICQCRYAEVPDHRRNKADRRQLPDRRENLRFEPDKPSRRKNHGRRKSDYQWEEKDKSP